MHASREREVTRRRRFRERGHHIEIERLADGARLLGAIEHRDPAVVEGNAERSAEAGNGRYNLTVMEPHLLPGRDHRLDRFGRGTGRGAHEHDHSLGVGGADVVD